MEIVKNFSELGSDIQSMMILIITDINKKSTHGVQRLLKECLEIAIIDSKGKTNLENKLGLISVARIRESSISYIKNNDECLNLILNNIPRSEQSSNRKVREEIQKIANDVFDELEKY